MNFRSDVGSGLSGVGPGHPHPKSTLTRKAGKLMLALSGGTVASSEVERCRVLTAGFPQKASSEKTLQRCARPAHGVASQRFHYVRWSHRASPALLGDVLWEGTTKTEY